MNKQGPERRAHRVKSAEGDTESSPGRKRSDMDAPGGLRKVNMHLPPLAEVRCAREEPKDLSSLIPAIPPTSPGPFPFSFRAPLTDEKLKSNAIRGLVLSVQEKDYVEGLPTAHNQIIILKFICVVLSAVLV